MSHPDSESYLLSVQAINDIGKEEMQKFAQEHKFHGPITEYKLNWYTPLFPGAPNNISVQLVHNTLNMRVPLSVYAGRMMAAQLNDQSLAKARETVHADMRLDMRLALASHGIFCAKHVFPVAAFSLVAGCGAEWLGNTLRRSYGTKALVATYAVVGGMAFLFGGSYTQYKEFQLTRQMTTDAHELIRLRNRQYAWSIGHFRVPGTSYISSLMRDKVYAE